MFVADGSLAPLSVKGPSSSSRPVTVDPVPPEEQSLWDATMAKHHPFGFRKAFGARRGHRIHEHAEGRKTVPGTFLFAAPTSHCRGTRPKESERIGQSAGGRKSAVEEDPEPLADLESLFAPETWGDPQSPPRRTRKSMRRTGADDARKPRDRRVVNLIADATTTSGLKN